ncbi:MAG: hypothetical protein HGB37_05425 [Candidatus Moranbacteria bacterium]|nr:hypothetical protein [Candidatus Moranbacteria bacterium]
MKCVLFIESIITRRSQIMQRYRIIGVLFCAVAFFPQGNALAVSQGEVPATPRLDGVLLVAAAIAVLWAIAWFVRFIRQRGRLWNRRADAEISLERYRSAYWKLPARLDEAEPHITDERMKKYRTFHSDAGSRLRKLEKRLSKVVRQDESGALDDWTEELGDLTKETEIASWYLVHAPLFARDIAYFIRRIDGDVTAVMRYIGTEGERFERNRERLENLRIEYDVLIRKIQARPHVKEFDYVGVSSQLLRLKNDYESLMYKEMARDVRDFFRSVPKEVWPHLGELAMMSRA